MSSVNAESAVEERPVHGSCLEALFATVPKRTAKMFLDATLIMVEAATKKGSKVTSGSVSLNGNSIEMKLKMRKVKIKKGNTVLTAKG